MVAPEDVAGLYEFLSQFSLVVDLTVENDADGRVLVPHRLMAALDVNDRQAAETKIQRIRRVDTVVGAIRTAMDNTGGHGLEVCTPPNTDEACQTAHIESGQPLRGKVDQLADVIGVLTLRFKIRAHHDLGNQTQADAQYAHHDGHYHQ